MRNPPLVVWVHGGAWSAGTRAQYPNGLVEKGFAVASLDFRQSTEARFPANVRDIKAGIRFLRAKAADYGYRTERIEAGCGFRRAARRTAATRSSAASRWSAR